MKRFLLCALSAYSLHAQGMPAIEVKGVGNFTHIVANLDKSVEFYRDVIGLPMNGEIRPWAANPAIWKMINLPNSQSRLATFKVPGSDIGIELIEYKGVERKAQSVRFQDPGAANLIVRLRDLDAVWARLGKFTGAKVITAAGKPVTINNAFKVVFVQDPDGFVVELNQSMTPAKSDLPATANVIGGAFELAIADTEQSVKFYRDVLGFDMKAGAAFNETPLMSATAGVPGSSFRQSRSVIPGVATTMTLIEFKGMARTPLTGRMQDPGTAILQLRVSDVDHFVDKLKAAGVPVISTGGVPADLGNGRHAAIVRDPNNLYLEILPNPQR